MSGMSNDHDLLIRVSTQVENLATEVRGYSQNTKATIDDHETRLRVLSSAMEQDRGARRNTTILLSLLSGAGTVIGIIAMFAK